MYYVRSLENSFSVANILGSWKKQKMIYINYNDNIFCEIQVEQTK